MATEDLLEEIYNWLGANFPNGPEWDDPKFHCFSGCHPIIRAVAAMDSVEGEISNGAWGQLLWNTFPNWRTVLELAGEGYSMMRAEAQVNALSALTAKLAAHEIACAAAMARAESGNFDAEFGAFTSQGYSDVGFKAQSIFLDGNLEEMRRNWLSENRAAVLHAIAA